MYVCAIEFECVPVCLSVQFSDTYFTHCCHNKLSFTVPQWKMKRYRTMDDNGFPRAVMCYNGTSQFATGSCFIIAGEK